MTLILGINCAEGIVLASDSQGTFETGGQPTKGPTDKIFCPWTNVAWGAAGHTGLIQRVDQHLRLKFGRTAFQSLHVDEIRKRLTHEVSEVVRPLYEKQFIQLPGTQTPVVDMLFAGYSGGKPFLLEIHPNLTDTDHISTGYAAVGSGDIFPYFALPSLAHFTVGARSLVEAKAIAYRVMEDAINVAAHGLGPPVQMIEITKPESGPGLTRQLAADEVRTLADAVLTWKSLESETLTQLLGITP